MIVFVTNTLSDPDDRAFMLALYQKYDKLMENTVRRYVFTPEDQEDVLQDSLVKLIQNIDKLRTIPCCTLPAYIVSIIRNTAYDHLRRTERKRAHQAEGEDIDLDAIPSTKNSPEELFCLTARKDALALIWDKLSETDQMLLKGKYLLGYSDRELGRLLHCKPDSIRTKLTRARRRALQLALDHFVMEDLS